MVSKDESPTWDFTSAIRLLQSLSNDHVTPSTAASPLSTDNDSSSEPDNEQQRQDSPTGLGNFNKLWQFLGSPLDVPAPKIDGQQDNENRYELLNTSGPIGVPPVTIKGVRWRDELDGAFLEDREEREQDQNTRLGRRVRRAMKKEEALKKQEAKAKAKSSIEYSYDEQGNRLFNWKDAMKANADSKRSKKKARKRAAPAKREATTSDVTTDAESGDELRKVRVSPDRAAVIRNMLYGSSPPTSSSPPKDPSINQSSKKDETLKYQVPHRAGVTTNPQILPLVFMSADQRRTQLVHKLMKDFPQQQPLLFNAATTDRGFNEHNLSPRGVHIFIDISNILIGFHEALKVAHNIPRTTHIRRVPVSFYNLSLILERGRPANKRVLAGSDHIPSINEAKALGYETNILARVSKAKELTARQKKHITTSSGSETANAALFAPEKWVEQGVDEILHLKMLESIVDAEMPSTIVLATGDAAEAEYSGGFMKMVERALERGWAVELVSFKMNTSSAYKRSEFRERWGERFRMIKLDEYLEELFGYND